MTTERRAAETRGYDENERLVRGAGRFVADLVTENTLHATFARSPFPHATVEAVDVREATESEGVVAVFTDASLAVRDIPAQLRPAAPPAIGMDRPVLARDRVRFVGEPIAMVVAESAMKATDAVELIWPELELLEAVVDPGAAESDQVILFPAAGTNVVVDSEVFAERDNSVTPWPITVRVEVHSPRLAAVPIEPLAILAEPGSDGRLTVWCGHQAPHRLKSQLVQLLDFGDGEIRVRVPRVGGAFGLKGGLYPEYLAVCKAAMMLERPVVWLQSRREHMSGGNHGRGLTQTVEMSGERDGRIRRIHIRVLGDLGAYPMNGFFVPTRAAMIGAGPYDVEDVRVEMSTVVTNTAPTGPYRGAGRPEGVLAVERAIDVFARKVGRDPVEVRATNLIRSHQLPYHTATGVVYDGGDYPGALIKAMELVDAAGIRHEQERRLRVGADPIGLGIAVFVEPAGGSAGSGEYAKVSVATDGRIEVMTGSTAAGQGHRTVWAQLAGRIFDVAPGSVRVCSGDTDLVAEGGGTYGSRSAQTGAVAVWRTGHRVLDEARVVAAVLLGVDASEVGLTDGIFSGPTGVGISLAEVAREAGRQGRVLAAEEFYRPGAETFPYGVHAAVVEVSKESGQVQILRLVAVDDCGEVLDEARAEGQIHGAIVQGIGQALFEEVRYDAAGQLLTATLADYLMPRAFDVPPIITSRLETPAPNELGVKGIGEAGTIGTPAAILNGVLDALAPYGVEDLTFPLLASRVWAALNMAGTILPG